MPDRPPLLRRRSVVLGAAAALAVSGCDSGDDIEPPGSGDRSPGAGTDVPSDTPSTPDAADRTPDQVLVDEVGAAVLGAMAVLAGARTSPRLRPAVTPLLRAHRQHLVVLEADDTFTTVGPDGADAATLLRTVRRSERALHARLVDAATRAESGALARLLASMSASVTQHLALLPAEVTP